MIQKTFYRKPFHSENRHTEKISFKCATHMERHFLGLVLTLLPEGVLAIVCHHFVLEKGIEIKFCRCKYCSFSVEKDLKYDNSQILPSGRSCSPFSIPQHRWVWTHCGRLEGSYHERKWLANILWKKSVSLVVIEDLWSQLALPRLKGFLVMLCKNICDFSVDYKSSLHTNDGCINRTRSHLALGGGDQLTNLGNIESEHRSK